MSSQATPRTPPDGYRDRPFMPIALGSFDVTIEHRPDGTIDVRPVQPLAPYPTRLTDRLHYWAGLAPDRVFIAERSAQGGWRTVTYAQTLDVVRCLGQSLVDYDLSAERPVLILSVASIMPFWIGRLSTSASMRRCAPSRAVSGFAKLRHVVHGC